VIVNRRLRLLYAALLFVAIALVFGPHLGNDFVLDDQAQVVENPHLGPDGSWLGIFQGDLWSHMREKIGSFHSYYRPMLYFTYKVTASLAGQSSFAFHIVSLLLHIACAALLYKFLGSLGLRKNVVLSAPLLFLFSPITGETVFYIADMCDQLVLLGLLAAFWSAQRGMKSGATWHWGITVFLGTAVGLLSKETAVVVPLLVSLLVIWRCGWRPRAVIRHAGPAWCAIILYLPLRWMFLGGSHLGGFTSSPWEGLTKAGLALAWYIRHLLVPYPLSPCHSFPNQIAGFWLPAFGISVLLAVGGCFFVALRRREWLFWLSWLLCPLFPTLFHFFFVQQITSGLVVAERYAYISATAFCSILALSIDRGSERFAGERKAHQTFWLITVALAATGGVLLGGYGKTYATDRVLFEHAVKINPNNPFVLNGVGQSLLKIGNSAKALEYFSRAVELQPNYNGWHINKGITLYRLGRLGAARDALQTAIALEADVAMAHTTLGDIYRDLGDIPSARQSYERSAELDPSSAIVWQNLGTARALSDNREGAIAAWTRSLELVPNSCDTHFNLGTALVNENHQRLARDHLLQFVECAGDDRASQIQEARRLLGVLED
jgi:tetratricopeptide (TPR) repeat protein